MGKLIVLEGTDGCGKSTQLEYLAVSLRECGVPFRAVSFPDYDSASGALIKEYLSGAYGESPADVNAYAASTFYAVDRYASCKRDWGRCYEAGGLIVTGRYTTSNAIHQAAKLPEGEREPFCRWLWDFEYGKLGLPRPDLVIFLDMPPEVSAKLLLKRYEGDVTRRDIHERDEVYELSCYEAAKFAADAFGWRTVTCSRGGEPRGVGEIAAEVLREVSSVL